MSQPPTPFARSWSFTDFSTNNPTTPHQGQKIDLELNNVLAVLNYTISRLNEIQADDGKVRNSGLNFTTIAAAIGPILSVSIINSINSAGSTQVAAVNAAGTTQVSAVNAAGATFAATASTVSTDAAAAASSATTAEGWKNSAQASALSATNSANTAFIHKNTALAYANDAFTHSDNAAASAAAAGFSLSGCISSAGQASYEASQANAYSIQAETSKVGALNAQSAAESASSSASSSAISATASAASASASAASAYNYYSAFNLSVGTVSTGAAGSQAVVTRTGTAPSYLLNFTIPAGAAGAAGTNGVGIPVGGTIGQALVKSSASDYATQWSTISAGAPLASPAFTGNVTITTNSASPALIIVQDGAGDIVQFKDVAADSTYSFINASGKVNTIASASANAGFSIAHGVAPTSPVNGDIWTTTTGLFVRVNGVTQTIPSTTTLASYLTTATAASTYYLQSNPSGFITSASLSGYALLNGSSAFSVLGDTVRSLDASDNFVQLNQTTLQFGNLSSGPTGLSVSGSGITFGDSSVQTTAAVGYDVKKGIANTCAGCMYLNNGYIHFNGGVALAQNASGKFSGSGQYRLGWTSGGSYAGTFSLSSTTNSLSDVIATTGTGYLTLSGERLAYSEDSGTTWTYSDFTF